MCERARVCVCVSVCGVSVRVCMSMFVATCLACSHSCVCAMFLHCVFLHRCGEVATFYHLCVCAAIIVFFVIDVFFCLCVCSAIVILFSPRLCVHSTIAVSFVTLYAFPSLFTLM